jgi:hypothetical protein
MSLQGVEETKYAIRPQFLERRLPEVVADVGHRMSFCLNHGAGTQPSIFSEKGEPKGASIANLAWKYRGDEAFFSNFFAASG